MIGTTGKARVRLQKGAPGRAGGSPTIATDVLFLPPSRKVTRTAAKPNGDDKEIAWVGIPFRITNPRGAGSSRPFSDRPAGKLCVAHSWKVFSGMLQKMPRSGSLLLLRRWHIFLRAGVRSVRRCRTSALRLVSSVPCSSLWATRSDASFPSSGGLGRGFDGLVPGSPHHSSH
jgi:hypothetical protein